jgi:hypothetical protein
VGTKPQDPDAALHAADPGKFKPGAAEVPGEDVAAAPPSSGTLADTITQMPDMRPVTPTAAPIEDPASLSQVFHASSREAQRDSSMADETRLAKGWAPIVQALGYDASENPAAFGELDPAGVARFGNAGERLSRLATAPASARSCRSQRTAWPIGRCRRRFSHRRSASAGRTA